MNPTEDAADGRPGLLLLSYGDFPPGFMDQPGHREAFASCLSFYEHLADSYLPASEHDELSGMSCRIAESLSRGSDGKVELAYMGLRRPGLREALYNTISSGSRTTVFVGGAGLITPGYTSLVHLPSTLRLVTRENAGLDVVYAPPGISVEAAIDLIKASLEHALCGHTMSLPGPGEALRPREDLGIVVVSAPDPRPALTRRDRLTVGYIKAAGALSEQSRASSGPEACSVVKLLTGVASGLGRTGLFKAVEPGFIDFSSPGPEEAMRRLEAAGSRQIIVTAAPSLLHRHGFSWETPGQVVDRLQAASDRDLIYLPPQTSVLSGWVSSILKNKVLSAELDGISVRGSLREC